MHCDSLACLTVLRATTRFHLSTQTNPYPVFRSMCVVIRCDSQVNRMWGRVNFSKRKERVDRSDRVFNINCLFKQYVDEWAVPVSTLPSALTALRTLLASHGFKAHFPIEVRFVAGDDIPLSPANGRPTAFVGIIAYKPYGYEVEHKEYFQVGSCGVRVCGCGFCSCCSRAWWVGSADGRCSLQRKFES